MLQKKLTRFLLFFASLFILSVPFPHPWIPDIASYIHPFFEWLVKWSGRHIFHIRHAYTSKLISDSTGLYLHLFNLVVFSILITILWAIVEKQKRDHQKLFYWFRIFITYYLALQLLDYGFNKLFKWQFYIPEPNTLFTTMGQTPRDLMYWSSMGVSRPYTVFVGITELLAALLLLFRRTRLAGALFAFVVLCNVVAVNFSYDISVKVYSCFLLLLSCIIMAQDGGRLFTFFIGGKNIPEKSEVAVFNSTRSKQLQIVLKIFVIAVILLSTLSVYFKGNNFNDDKAPRPAFHGAYDVLMFARNDDTLPPLLTDSLRWRRVFVHRRGYFIVQDMSDNMQDYELLVDTINHNFIIEREEDGKQFNLSYKKYHDSTLTLNGEINKDSVWIKLKPIDLKQLPALQHEFNWAIDN
ncbi:MAG: hypothetical protein ABI685_12480 [Ferruginibacter sp.]